MTKNIIKMGWKKKYINCLNDEKYNQNGMKDKIQ